MPRAKKPHLKKRKDGYYVCRYKDQWFYSLDEADCLAQRQEYKDLEKAGDLSLLTGPKLSDYAEKYMRSAKTGTAAHTRNEAKIQMRKLTDALGDKYLADILPSDIREVYSSAFAGLSNSLTSSSSFLADSFQ